MAQDILIVDDEADIRALIAGILEDEGFETREAASSCQAAQAIATRRPGLVLLDIWLQGSELDGLGILNEVKRDHPEIPVLMMSGHGTVETAVAAIKDGAYDFIEKPFKADRLLLLIRRAIEAARLRRENEDLRVRAGAATTLTGKSSAVREARQLIERVAPTNSRVLITGPSGAGKEVVARMIHAHSNRSEGPFILVNCAMMLPERMEIELFGTEGDDSERKVGTFEQAHGGTLLLDEVTDMPLETQSKIIRVLQEQIFERVGGTNKVEVNVRVIASATRDIQAEIDAGRFREDLYYRLNVVPFKVPPLKDRTEDIEVLSHHFLERAAETNGQQPRTLRADAVAALRAYEWPGNVRELRNVIERTLIMAPEDKTLPIGADLLPAEITSQSPASVNKGDGGELLALQLRDAREMFERQYLSAQMARFGGNISKTAQFVGMERSALHRKLKSLGLSGEERAERVRT